MEIYEIIVKTISALLVPSIAIIGSFITYKQMLLARERLKHDLYEKRFSVFEKVMKFIARVVQTGRCETDDLLQLKRDTSEVPFLFESDVSNYIDCLYKKVASFIALSQY